MSYRMQHNGVKEMLSPINRERVEAYYLSKGIGPSAKDRFMHLSELKDGLIQTAYDNWRKGADVVTEAMVNLAPIEWCLWEWEGVM